MIFNHFRCAFLLGLLLLSVKGAAQSRQQMNAESYYVMGKQYTEYGYYSESVPSYKHALRIDPNYVLASYGLADAYLHLKDTVNAVKYYENTIALNPRHADSHYVLATIYQRRNLTEKALAQYKAAAQCNASYTRYYQDYAEHLALAENRTSAVAQPVRPKEHSDIEAKEKTAADSVEMSRKNAESIRLFVDAASLYQKAGKYDDAVASYQKVLAMNPNHAEACEGVGYCFLQLKNLPDATTYLKRAAELKPGNAAYLYALGEVYRKQGKNEDALSCLSKAQNLDSQYADEYGELLREVRMVKESNMSKMDKIREQQARRKVSKTAEKAKLAPPVKAEKTEQPVKEELAKTEPVKAKPVEQPVKEELAKTEPVKAKPVEQPVKVEPAEQPTTNDQSEQPTTNGEQPATADTDATKEAVKLFCTSGAQFYRAGDFPNALQSYQKAYKQNPTAAEPNCGLAMTYFRMEQYETAVRYFSAAVALVPENALMYSNMALSYEKLGQYTEALEAMQKAQKFDPYYKNEYKAMAKRIRKHK
jgi:tetratricopeptide (TPR) repeat protein